MGGIWHDGSCHPALWLRKLEAETEGRTEARVISPAMYKVNAKGGSRTGDHRSNLFSPGSSHVGDLEHVVDKFQRRRLR